MGGGQNIGNLLIGQVFPSNLVYFDGISLNRIREADSEQREIFSLNFL